MRGAAMASEDVARIMRVRARGSGRPQDLPRRAHLSRFSILGSVDDLVKIVRLAERPLESGAFTTVRICKGSRSHGFRPIFASRIPFQNPAQREPSYEWAPFTACSAPGHPYRTILNRSSGDPYC
jgi:hypothetical protein